MSLKAFYHQNKKPDLLLNVVTVGPDGSVKPVESAGSLGAGSLVTLATDQGVVVVAGCPLSEQGEDGTALLVRPPAPVRRAVKPKAEGPGAGAGAGAAADASEEVAGAGAEVTEASFEG